MKGILDIGILEKEKLCMELRKSVNKVIGTPMERRQFLGYLGGTMLVIIGIPSILCGLSKLNNPNYAFSDNGSHGGLK